MAEKLNLGKVSITAEGAYNPSMSYDKLTCVFYNGVSWLSRKAVPTGVAPTEENSAYWQKMSDRGAQGVPGPQGPAGEGGRTEPQIINVELSEEYVTAIKKGYLNHDGVLRDPIAPIMLQGDLEAGRYTKIVANGTEVLAEGYTNAMNMFNIPMTTVVYPTEMFGETLDNFNRPLIMAAQGTIAVAYLGLPYDSEIKIVDNEVKVEDTEVLKKYYYLDNQPRIKVTRVTNYSDGSSSIRGIYVNTSVHYASQVQNINSLESQDSSLIITYDAEGKIQRVINHDMTPEAVYKAIDTVKESIISTINKDY